MKAIEVTNLTKYYRKVKGIENINFSVDEGEIFGFIGPNGAGKSTAIRTLLNFIYPTSGGAQIFGKDIVKETKEIREFIGYLPSEVHYYDDMKVKDLLEYSGKFYKSFDKDYYKKIAHSLDLNIERKIEDLSFGNRKKVGIVQALLHKPKLLILDEPTGGLDPLMQQSFFEILKEKQKEGTTVFFSSHYLGEVQKMCDRVAIIKDGSILKVERIEDLRSTQFRKVYISLASDYKQDLTINGAMDVKEDGEQMQFLYNGEARELVQQLASFPLRDIRIEEPSLEEIFMHYYEK
ncbi:ABC transporter [Lottiidibacillus patelloidae]|uniref:ABC transporter n=1 Tax=Lottiidibacillus patelloidae TaxID=2670334 RepID=A0A263BTB4_9BACI|nr:ABC transporter ATP-binding protein [Lottiidibacillus patelloidae]OZM56808.1 ABC transporter [Lottiidibacillus patelloidae]